MTSQERDIQRGLGLMQVCVVTVPGSMFKDPEISPERTFGCFGSATRGDSRAGACLEYSELEFVGILAA
ncbi:MAG: hypothetical protein ACP5MD_16445 [Verrucomicrobiia bacterium]